MEDYLKKFGITPYINAHDTLTLYGASRMAPETRTAMSQISECFVDLLELQRILGRQIAGLTRNEAAYICGGAAAGVQLCAAVCIAQGDEFIYRGLPSTRDAPDEFIVMHGQHICYDKAIEGAGGKIRLVGDADTVRENDLRRSIGEKTAGLFYFPAINFVRASLGLEKTIEIAHEAGIPVVVDAAAQLPPAENLWKFTEMGADMVIFSGGKTLSGPQASGLIVGRQRYIDDCIRFGSPNHGVCRASKASREDMIGLRVAVENYLAMDHGENSRRLSAMADRIIGALKEFPFIEPRRVEHGSVGQPYPRVFAVLSPGYSSAELAARMKERRIFTGSDSMENALIISPQNLTDEECAIVIAALTDICRKMKQES
ncbi:aminotransferase class V-fold PLP-dependent enzyme [Breznakiella homolactica]|uniref:Aminotransferase class V-fold PLP-dependent enzyme n=1 Tax=Breznakiella homolactica TaxID=2798577 RepID=A0A7T7XRQ2_9SPIR|nr:aminotransferase class V-fold PLP-dependent enzyme [Breznakiella homolactica]QQO11250.1 aminotransferase class V-fold PLP-dependent enzyme [Breznakiella homolactica]